MIQIKSGAYSLSAEITDNQGQKIESIKGIDIQMRPDQFNHATLEMEAKSIDIQAEPTFVLFNPDTGEREEVKEVHFKSGNVWRPNV